MSASLTTRERWFGSDRWMDFALVALLFAGSALGNIAAFNGGFDATFRGSWSPLDWRIGLVPLILGGGMQAGLQWRQFANSEGTLADRLTNGRYVSALLISAVPSLWTFFPVLTQWLDPFLPWGLTYATAALIAGIVVFAVDILQEQLLFSEA